MEMPKEVQNLIKRYFNLKIGGKIVKTPYYINKKHSRGGELRSLVGKGGPTEIEEEVKIFAKLRGVNLTKATPDQIREFMQQEGIGIDCSGFVSHILHRWLKSQNKGSLHSNLEFNNKNILDALIKFLRPIQNISANLLTNDTNSTPVEISQARIGDLIRLKGLKHGHHIAIISKVEKDENDKLVLEYLHSTPHYGDNSGVKRGKILITNVNQELEKQKWLEFDENNECWTLKQYLKDKNDNGLRRSKFFTN